MQKINTEQCNEALSGLMDLLNEGIEKDRLEDLVTKYPGCEKVLRTQLHIWQGLKEIDTPMPSSSLHARFYRTLSEMQSQENKESPFRRLGKNLNQWLLVLSPQARWAFITGIFILGMVSGFLINRDDGNRMQMIARDNQDLNVISASTVPQSANIRMKEIQNVKDIKNPNQKIFEALNDVLLHDPNINVRLSAIESLVYFADHPKVREYLIQAIPFQDSPLVQVALADAMILLHEKRSSDQWQKLFESGNVETDVKMHLEETLEPLLY